MREYLPYDVIFDEIEVGIKKILPFDIQNSIIEWEHSAPNRLRIFLRGKKSTHYEICFRQMYVEFALHFESTPARNLERRQLFDPFLQQYTDQIGIYVKSGPLENKGRMRIWYEENRKNGTEIDTTNYAIRFSKFIEATFPNLILAY